MTPLLIISFLYYVTFKQQQKTTWLLYFLSIFFCACLSSARFSNRTRRHTELTDRVTSFTNPTHDHAWEEQLSEINEEIFVAWMCFKTISYHARCLQWFGRFEIISGGRMCYSSSLMIRTSCVISNKYIWV